MTGLASVLPTPFSLSLAIEKQGKVQMDREETQGLRSSLSGLSGCRVRGVMEKAALAGGLTEAWLGVL